MKLKFLPLISLLVTNAIFASEAGPKEVEKLLGYNPRITLIRENNTSAIKHQIEDSSISSWLTSWFGSRTSSFSAASSAASADYVTPAFLKKYRPWNEQAFNHLIKQKIFYLR